MTDLQEVTGVDSPSQDRTQDEWKNQLAQWRLSFERANRCNRDLMQYAAATAALLGIGAGSGGLAMLAKSVERPVQQAASQSPPMPTASLPPTVPTAMPTTVATAQAWAEPVLSAVIVVCIAGAILLILGLAYTFLQRLRAEREADDHLDKLVRAKPENFLPKAPEASAPSAHA